MQHTRSKVIGFQHYVNVLNFSIQTKWNYVKLEYVIVSYVKFLIIARI